MYRLVSTGTPFSVPPLCHRCVLHPIHRQPIATYHVMVGDPDECPCRHVVSWPRQWETANRAANLIVRSISCIHSSVCNMPGPFVTQCAKPCLSLLSNAFMSNTETCPAAAPVWFDKDLHVRRGPCPGKIGGCRRSSCLFVRFSGLPVNFQAKLH